MPKPRRGLLEMIRDLLLAIAMAPDQQEKPTRIMYAIGTSWRTMAGRDANPDKGIEEEEGLLGLVERKGLIEDVGWGMVTSGNQRGRQPSKRDKRSPSVYKITERGLLVLRLMDLLYVFLESESPQVRMPPAILRILARATNYGESLDAIVQNIAYTPRLSHLANAETSLDNLLKDMTDESIVINEAEPDKDKLSEAMDIVVDDTTKRLVREKTTGYITPRASEGMAQLASDVPAEFFVNSIVKGVEEIEAQTGEFSMPAQREASIEVVETVKLWENFEDKIVTLKLEFDPSYGLQCPVCDYRTFSVRTKQTMKRHFKENHPEYTLLFDES